MKSAVIVFPGSNCDRDAYTVLRSVMKEKFPLPPAGEEDLVSELSKSGGGNAAERVWPRPMKFSAENSGDKVKKIWHGDSELPDVDLVVIPGGFSYGDYLRSGAMAAHSPIMCEVVAHAKHGRLLLGICNGFQILTEAGLLPGVLLRNAGLKFLCKPVHLRVENNATAFTSAYKKGQVIRVPIAHHDGNYFADEATLDALENNEQIAFRYCDEKGNTSPEANPNGSARHIAGIFNESKNVLGMMPHPERHSELLTGGIDGRALFEALAVA